MEGKAIKKMIKWQVDPPQIFKSFYSQIIWNSINDKILITFDDGPHTGSNDKILEKLHNYNYKALFFVEGRFVKSNKSLLNEILAEGHQLGNHSFSHKNLRKSNKEDLLEEIKSTNDSISEIIGESVQFFRPPYGKFNSEILKISKQLKLNTVLWSLLTYDYKNNFEIVKLALNKYLQNNSIVVFHHLEKCVEVTCDGIDLINNLVEENKFKIGIPEECLK
ncbi:MAG: polysaccharide deacetylase family protein [Melioribacteraceae bacterium]|nr:polysaccharide deacetylase family protein [Melioribacteraceae bacterium]MCF8265798.1 polysaccharide deacetylase family protein [Melioribacteraceae bacterium]MCF8412123.1 polysaccharide deacetylase family protein [Melioribacteraceae bacterium]MCF8431302.1 polysaccharide deacetylase family protein [Melioribacteraceae bacterium]